MRFWDASALVPLLVQQDATAAMKAIYAEDAEMAVWWGSLVEAESALARLGRDGSFSPEGAEAARGRLDELSQAWMEVTPGERLRSSARRLLRVHPLRSGDALQLAAALVAAEQRPETLPFVCLDERLAGAARLEGFRVVTAAVVKVKRRRR
jgi:predicted nucleic acid-binding protein